MVPVSLNIDLGEHPGEAEELYALAHLANVACGGHAGDRDSMRRAAERCRLHGARLGAHPSFPDREGFGRRELAMSAADLRAAIAEQLGALLRACDELLLPIGHVKPHGALYHAANRERAIAEALLDGAADVLGESFLLLGPAGGALADAAAARGLPHAREGFADRGYREDGGLVPRGEAHALVEDPISAARQAARLVRAGTVDTICVHGDGPYAAAIARAVRAELDRW